MVSQQVPQGIGELQVDGVTVAFHNAKGEPVHALYDVSFAMSRPREFITVVGPSGCGKTTLLNVIAGFIAPSVGRVSLGGQEISGPAHERGVVFQDGALFEWLTVAENVAFGLRMRGVSVSERRRRVSHLLGIVGLAEFANAPIYQLSGGMRQRVALIRCLVNDPSIILMDEPLGALDALTREKMQGLIRRVVNDAGSRALFITHSVEEALFLGTRLFVMTPRPGRIVKEYFPQFAAMDLKEDSRKIKSLPEFVKMREEVLGIIWSAEEESNF